jgi:antitoxin (DNA-binding transcriptional repressor) of toxin-antitoxin stability system
VITRHGKPVVRLIPVSGTNSLVAIRGALRGAHSMAEAFDELPDDIADALVLGDARA